MESWVFLGSFYGGGSIVMRPKITHGNNTEITKSKQVIPSERDPKRLAAPFTSQPDVSGASQETTRVPFQKRRNSTRPLNLALQKLPL
jgi:hypothetical protein